MDAEGHPVRSALDIMNTMYLGLLDNKTENLYLGSLSLNNAPPAMPQDGFPARVPTPPSQVRPSAPIGRPARK